MFDGLLNEGLAKFDGESLRCSMDLGGSLHLRHGGHVQPSLGRDRSAEGIRWRKNPRKIAERSEKSPTCRKGPRDQEMILIRSCLGGRTEGP